ncbi:MAG: carboxypeptidase-like regulatory domain-containing protein [Janthinobacterium lividum]
MLPRGASAQYTRTPMRNITGTVTDGGHEPLRGAVVQIEALDTLVIESYQTNESGEYHFRNLRSDADFSVWATFRGNRSKPHSIGKFDHTADRDIPITVVLEK